MLEKKLQAFLRYLVELYGVRPPAGYTFGRLIIGDWF
jgi:hypothetical protein